jgi:hypothetical protein
MKRILPFAVISLFVTFGYAQRENITGHQLPLIMQEKAPEITPEGTDVSLINFFPGQADYSIWMQLIGDTYFDTQTYNSGNLMNRIYKFQDGTIGATWMLVGETGTPDRGTAYNYFDGVQWGEQDPHLGTAPKTGFPSYAPWGPNGEVVAHYEYIAGDGPIKILRRENKGVGDWQESILNPPVGNYSLVWHSMITSGPNHEYIHLLALVYDDPYLGQDDALLYYRSSDGGVTWDINGVVIDGLGAGFYPTISSLKYSWAQPVGNTIAFTFGFDEFDGLVFKSTDNGDTWQKIVVYDSPFDPMNVPADIDNYGCGDGTSAITLDSQGKAHVVFGRMIRSRASSTWYYSPLGSEGLIYWDESMPPLDSTIVSSYTLENLAAAGNLVGWITPTTATVNILNGQPNYGVGLTSQPQLSMNNDNEFSLVYSAISPENTLDGIYYRHLYFTRTFDGGQTWSDPYPLNNDILFSFSECVYPAVAPLYDGGYLYVLFQEDASPGTGAGFGLGEENYMTFFGVMLFNSSTKDLQMPAYFEVSSCYPNPAVNLARLAVKLTNTSRISLKVTDISGREVTPKEQKVMNAGIGFLTVDVSDFRPGIYFCTVEVNGMQVTRKLIVQ